MNALLEGIGSALDGLEVAFCAFDREDRTIAWNRTFLEFFPEHDGFVHVGEPYAENLRRFYTQRLQGDEALRMDRYIAEGIERHRTQRRPFEFDHRGFRVRVASVEIGAFGRVRFWRKVAPLAAGDRRGSQVRAGPFDPNASLVLERIADGVLVVDSGERILWANKAFRDLYAAGSVDDLAGQTFEALYARAWSGAAQAPEYRRSLETLRENQRFAGAPFELCLPGDRWVRVVEQRGDEVDGKGYLLHADITASKRREKALQEAQVRAHESEAKYRLLAEYSSDITVAVADGVFVYVSPSVKSVLGWSPEDLLGKTVDEFCHPDEADGVAAALQSLSEAPQSDYRARARSAEGGYVWIEARARRSSQLSTSGAPVVVINLRDISVRKALEDELATARRRLEELAITDGLTGLANRRRFDEALDLECRRAQREGLPLSLVLLDVDHFKALNDNHGHQAGDRVLRRLASLLSGAASRAGDLAARFGGDEFALLLPNTPAAKAAEIVGRVREAVQSLNGTAFSQAPVTVSAGVGSSDNPMTDGTPADLLRLTDEALYAAKRSGRDRVAMAAVGGAGALDGNAR